MSELERCYRCDQHDRSTERRSKIDTQEFYSPYLIMHMLIEGIHRVQQEGGFYDKEFLQK